MVLIRIFKTRKEIELARAILLKGGINTTISEDKFEGVPIQNYGVTARFRLHAATKDDLARAAKYLKNLLSKKG